MVAANNAGAALFANGSFGDAARIQRRVLDIRRDNLIQQRIQNLMAVGSSGSTIYEMDDVSVEANDAVDMGPKAQLKLTNLSDRITNALENGQLDQVDALQFETWKLIKEVAGPGHRNSLSMMHALINKYSKRGDWAEVLHLQEEEIEIMKRSFGAEHSRTLGRIPNLSQTLTMQGKWVEAQALLQKYLPVSTRCLGSQHVVTETFMRNLMNTYQKLDLKEEYAVIQSQLKGRYRMEIEKQHIMNRAISDSMADLALMYRAQGRLQEAGMLLGKSLKKEKGSLVLNIQRLSKLFLTWH
jgi:tetratricopeptide (TPR) repeat protein